MSKQSRRSEARTLQKKAVDELRKNNKASTSDIPGLRFFVDECHVYYEWGESKKGLRSRWFYEQSIRLAHELNGKFSP